MGMMLKPQAGGGVGPEKEHLPHVLLVQTEGARKREQQRLEARGSQVSEGRPPLPSGRSTGRAVGSEPRWDPKGPRVAPDHLGLIRLWEAFEWF